MSTVYNLIDAEGEAIGYANLVNKIEDGDGTKLGVWLTCAHLVWKAFALERERSLEGRGSLEVLNRIIRLSSEGELNGDSLEVVECVYPRRMSFDGILLISRFPEGGIIHAIGEESIDKNASLQFINNKQPVGVEIHQPVQKPTVGDPEAVTYREIKPKDSGDVRFEEALQGGISGAPLIGMNSDKRKALLLGVVCGGEFLRDQGEYGDERGQFGHILDVEEFISEFGDFHCCETVEELAFHRYRSRAASINDSDNSEAISIEEGDPIKVADFSEEDKQLMNEAIFESFPLFSLKGWKEHFSDSIHLPSRKCRQASLAASAKLYSHIDSGTQLAAKMELAARLSSKFAELTKIHDILAEDSGQAAQNAYSSSRSDILRIAKPFLKRMEEAMGGQEEDSPHFLSVVGQLCDELEKGVNKDGMPSLDRRQAISRVMTKYRDTFDDLQFVKASTSEMRVHYNNFRKHFTADSSNDGQSYAERKLKFSELFYDAWKGVAG